MKRRLCILLTAIMLLSALSPVMANAAEPRILSIAPSLSFSGTTAYCELTVVGDYSTDEYEATVKLWEGNTCIKTWTCSGTGYIEFSKTYTVKLNTEYTLTADVTVNDVTKPRVYIRRTS